jgi:putative membrane protein insertion efficiency factor
VTALRAAELPIAFIRGYQRLVSPWLGECCRFHPSCSEYMIGSIRLNGLLLGTAAGAWRILRCNPLSRGGVDVPRRFRILP